MFERIGSWTELDKREQFQRHQISDLSTLLFVTPTQLKMAPTSKENKSNTKGKGKPIPTEPQPICWPSVLRDPHLPPLAFSDELCEGLLVIDTFFTSSLLNNWISFLSQKSSPIVLLPSPAARRGEAARTNYRFGVQDETFAKRLWEDSGLKELCENALESSYKGKKAVGLNPNIRLYSYKEGSYFGR